MASDEGSQVVTIRFQRAVDSDIVNKRFLDIRELGIYKGGYLTKTGGDNVSLTALVCEISDGTHQVRVATTVAVVKTLTEGSPYLVLNWVYTGVVSTDFMVIETSSSPSANDLVIGKGVFVASALSTIDYSERSTPTALSLFLRVEATETPSTSVRVRAGIGHAGSAHNAIIDQVVDLSGYNLNDVIYIYINDTGGVAHSATVATYGGKALLAKIVYPNGVIANSIITDVRSFVASPAIPDESTITRDSFGNLEVKDEGVGSDQLGSAAVIPSKVGNLFGAWQTKDSLNSIFVVGATYKAGSDGFVSMYDSGGNSLTGFTDSSSPATVQRTGADIHVPGPNGFLMPVRKNDYWRVAGLGDIYWIPFGSGVCVKQ